jgi:hypothetical protein
MRWLTVVVGVGVAAAALYALLATPPARRAPAPKRVPPAAPAVPRGPVAPPLGEIDDASRAQLEEVLRDAEQEEVRR